MVCFENLLTMVEPTLLNKDTSILHSYNALLSTFQMTLCKLYAYYTRKTYNDCTIVRVMIHQREDVMNDCSNYSRIEVQMENNLTS